MINFAHIAPTPHLDDFCSDQTHHLLLAHLVEADHEYANWYADNKRSKNSDNVYIMDNSAFECFKAGLPMYPSDKLIAMGHKVMADYIVMSDYPGEPSSKTIEAACQLAPKFRDNGFGTFFVPQSRIGDIEDYISAFAWAASSPLVDYIGVSILGVPNAYGVEKGNKLQRFFSRWHMMSELDRRGILALAESNKKKIHFLGMVDGPNEVSLCYPTFKIDTWDSSAGVWAGLNNIAFDNSPTGLINGKFEEEVDFAFHSKDSSVIAKAKDNVRHINKLCRDPAMTIGDLLPLLKQAKI